MAFFISSALMPRPTAPAMKLAPSHMWMLHHRPALNCRLLKNNNMHTQGVRNAKRRSATISELPDARVSSQSPSSPALNAASSTSACLPVHSMRT